VTVRAWWKGPQRADAGRLERPCRAVRSLTKVTKLAAKAGLRVGDVVSAVDGTSLADWESVRRERRCSRQQLARLRR
jgi:membrane-associated protease RseP (regulator of RpoE activity)